MVTTFFVYVADATLLHFSCHQQIQTRRDAQEDLSKTIGRQRERPRWEATADIVTELFQQLRSCTDHGRMASPTVQPSKSSSSPPTTHSPLARPAWVQVSLGNKG